MIQAQQEASERELLTVDQFCQREPAFKPGGIRWQIFNAGSNGLAASGAIVRLGRRVLIDRPKYFRWIDSQQRAA